MALECKRTAATGLVVSNPSNIPLQALPSTMDLVKDQENACGTSTRHSRADVDVREVYFLIMHFLSDGPCRKACAQLKEELEEHKLLPRRFHAWYSRVGLPSGENEDNGTSVPLTYSQLLDRFSFIEKNHLVKLLEELFKRSASLLTDARHPTAADASTLLGNGSVSLLSMDECEIKEAKWHWNRVGQNYGLMLREIGGGLARHHQAPSIRAASYQIVKPSVLVDRIQNTKTIRGHRNAVYCAIFDKSGEYIITGSDDRLVKIWSTTTGFCLCSCRGHEGDITDLAVSANNLLLASASNDYFIRVWRFPVGFPVSVLKGHTGAVTAIAFSPRQGCEHHLLSTSDDGTCRIWDARDSSINARVYAPRPEGQESGVKSMDLGQQNAQSKTQILCCAFNASGTVFVTGSSDKLARVWDACKWTDDVHGGPNHEFDTLKGHEDDVNYVQFSGCVASSRPTNVDTRPVNLGAPAKNERISRFRNSWFGYESIVSCSRDGSAIIWVPRPRKYHGKSKWMKGYHLRVPPPPMPPQPYRGIPRQRLLPTPRGVNMIVWSLDNRYVLAAIMDCRICVWNAVDGVLVHSLTGHTKSTFVLDVHPYDPRIAMSAGYDGRVIIWDIWEGHSIHEYKIGDFHLVDGKFSPDGTSIVISDEVGQIYFLSTGEGSSQNDAQYDQFFLGDYQPLSRDVHGNVLDQETQISPHERNMRDLLCDANMIPYAEPYQSMYQRRRLGAIGMTWHPPPAQWVAGSSDDSSYLTVAFPLLPPPAEDDGVPEGHQGGMRWVEQPFDEEAMAMEWEQDTVDDAGSDYTLSLDNECEEDERDCTLSSSEGLLDSLEEEDEEEYFSGGDEFSQRASLRRSKRNKGKEEDLITSTGGRSSKRKQRDGVRDYSLRRSKRRKENKRRSRNCVSRRSSDGEQPMRRRPKRLAARNARLFFSQIGAEENEHSNADSAEDADSEEEEELSSRQSLEKEDSDKSSAEKIDDGSTADAELCQDGWRRPQLHRSSKHGISTRRSSKGETSSQTGASAFVGEENLEMQVQRSPLRSNDLAFQEESPDTHGDGIRQTSKEMQDLRDFHEISGLQQLPLESDSVSQHGGKRRREDCSVIANKSPKMGSWIEDPAQPIEDGDPTGNGAFADSSPRGQEASLQQTGTVEPSRHVVSADGGGYESDRSPYASIEGDGGGVGLINEYTDLEQIDNAVQGYRRVSLDNGSHKTGLHKNGAGDAELLDEGKVSNLNLCGVGVNNNQTTKGRQQMQIMSAEHHDGLELNQSVRLKRVFLEDGMHEPDMNISSEEGHTEDYALHHSNHQLNIDHHVKEENDSEISGPPLDKYEMTRGGFEVRNCSTPPVRQTHKPTGIAIRRHPPMGTSWQHNSPISLWLREGIAEAQCNQSSSSEVEYRDHENTPSGNDVAGLRHPLRLKFRRGKRRLMLPKKKMESKPDSPTAPGCLQEVKDMPKPPAENCDTGFDDELLGMMKVTHTYVRTRRNLVADTRDRSLARKSTESGLRTERREGLRPSLRSKSIANDGELGKVTGGGSWKGKGSSTKESWLMLIKVEDGTRYIPQLGDEVAYVLQGHEEFPMFGRLEERSMPKGLRSRLRAVEMCQVVGIEYKNISGFDGVSCRLTLRLIDEECPAVGQTFRVFLPELTDFPDFIINRSRYEASIGRNWRKRDRCKVWWRTSINEDGEEKSGRWFIGRIISVETKSQLFPDSPWESCLVQYLGDSTGPHRHCPWELFDVDSDEKMPSRLDDGTRVHLLATIEDIEESNQFEYGLDALTKLVCKSDFINRTLVPLSLETIRERLRNEYYRSLEAFQHDVQLLASNVEMYLLDDNLTCKVQNLADRLLKEAGESIES